MLCLYSGFVACLEESFQAFVPEAYDHVMNINCNPVGGKIKISRQKKLGDRWPGRRYDDSALCSLFWKEITNVIKVL
jgi:hypothetical protein